MCMQSQIATQILRTKEFAQHFILESVENNQALTLYLTIFI